MCEGLKTPRYLGLWLPNSLFSVVDKMKEVKIGDKIRIIKMEGEPQYDGKEGIVELIDGAGQIHGTWGSCALIPEVDIFEVINSEK